MNTNNQIAMQFSEMADIISCNKQNSSDGFRANAYDKAATKLAKCTTDLTKLTAKEIQKLVGVGKASAEKIRQALDADDNTIPKLHVLRAVNAGNIKQQSEFTPEEWHRPVRRVLTVLNPTKSVKEIIVKRPDTKVYIVEAGVANVQRIVNMLAGVSMPAYNDNVAPTLKRVHRRSHELEFYVYFA